MEYKKRYDKIYSHHIFQTFEEDDKSHKLNFWNEYESTPEEKQLLIDRISTRITESNQTPRYYGEKITKEQAIEILKR